MSLKITDSNGFKIGGVQNPSITTIYIRCLCDMKQQNPIEDSEGNMTQIEVNTEAKTTILGGLFDAYINIEGINPIYWLKYSTSISDMNQLYAEIENDLKAKLEAQQPDWTITIVTLGPNQAQ